MDFVEDRDGPFVDVVSRGFMLAAEFGDECRPAHLLGALAELAGPIGDALAPADGGRLVPRPADPLPVRGGSGGYLADQTQELGQEIAASLDQPVGPEHLFLAVLDQGDEEVMSRLTSAGLEIAALRTVALDLLSAPPDLSPLRMPALTPAGTLDRPPLPIEELDPRVWRVLCWRQEHLPLDRIRCEADWFALSALEVRAVWSLADRVHLNNDQRYSISAQHIREVERRARTAKPECVRLRPQPAGPGEGGFLYSRPRSLRSRITPNFMVGWPTWFGNRRVGIRDQRFRLLTWRVYRGQPPLST